MKDAKYRITVEIDDAEGTMRTPQEARNFAGTIGASAGAQWDASFRPKVEIVEIGPAGVEPKTAYEEGLIRLNDEALAQIQCIAYEGGLLGEAAEADGAIEGSGQDALRALTAKLQRVCNIAEAREADEDWEPLIEDGEGDIDGDERMTGGVGSIPSILEPAGTRHPGSEAKEVYTVQVEGREDGLYVFGDIGDRNAFATAVESEGGLAIRGAETLNDEAGAKALIAAEVESTPAFEISAIVRVDAADPDAAYAAASQLVRLAADTDGRVHLALLEGAERVGS